MGCTQSAHGEPAADVSIDAKHKGFQQVDEEQLETFIAELDTGDIVLMCSTDTIDKVMEHVLLGMTWDHVAVIIKQHRPRTGDCPSGGSCSPQSCRCFDATSVGEVQLMEAANNAQGGGAHVYEFYNRLTRRDGHSVLGDHDKYVAVRRRRRDVVLTDEQREKAEECIAELRGRKFETNMGEMVSAQMTTHGVAMVDKNDETLETLFCAELVTEMLQRLQFLPEDTLNSNRIAPEHYSSSCEVLDRFKTLLPSFNQLYEPEVLIKWPSSKLTAKLERNKADFKKQRAAAKAAAKAEAD